MKLKKLSFKNFKSYSNIMTEFEINDNSSLNLIVGENGTGKTSIAECITYLLYGKIDNFNASDIPNRINKNFYGKLELECDGHNIIIERGLNPSLFKVEIDGIVVDTAGKANVQAMLEDSYYHIPYSVINSVIILEVGEVKSLLSMNPSDKRNIVDKICGFELYNKISKIVKEDAKALNEKIIENRSALRTTTANLDQYERQINEINSTSISQEELDQLREKDPTAAEAMWNTNLPRVVDAYAKMQYLKYEYTSRVIPAHTEWRTRHVRRTFYDRNGNKHEDLVPEEYPEFVPEKTIWTLHQQVRLDVYDAKTGQCIYSRNENRSDDFAGDGKDIFVKIVRNSFKDFVKKCQK